MVRFEDWLVAHKEQINTAAYGLFEEFFELQAMYSTEIFEQKTNVGYNLFEGLL